MSVIKNTLKTIIPRSVRKLLIKKVMLKDITEQQKFIVINLSIKNFYNLKSNDMIKVTLNNGEYTEELEYTIGKNMLSIQLLKTSLKHLTGNSLINLSVNNKHMIIDDNGTETTTSFVEDGKYYNILADGTLMLEHLFEAYTFNQNYIEVEEITSEYECLKLTFEHTKNVESYNLVLLYPNKIVELVNVGSGPILEVELFNDVTMGKARICVMRGPNLNRVELAGQQADLMTKRHDITLFSEGAGLVAQIDNHKLEMSSLNCELDNDEVIINLSYNAEFELTNFIVIDTISNEESFFPLSKLGRSKYRARVPLDILINNFTRKNFKLLTNGHEPVILQPNVNHLQIFGFSELLTVNYNYENLQLLFYKRKDDALGLKVTRPRIKREVTSIDQFNLKGYITGQENFIDCQPHMIFEDRYSKEYSSVPIDNTFDIQLNSIDLNGVKSKDKTIIDIFVAMIHDRGEIVRKEKIKYKLSDYKKDNYYGSHTTKDTEGNMYYYLITTTPFNNLKIESFIIPNTVPIHEDTSVKDYNVWLVGERYDTAQDNGYALFKYLTDKTPVEAYYVIEGSAPDYKKIKDNPNVLIFGSVEHFKVAFKAGVMLGTHDLENLLPYKPTRGFFNYEDTLRVFLQHGVLGRKRVEYHKKYYDLPFDLFIVSSQPEKDKVVVEKLGYDADEVAVTGLARFDSLPRGNKTKDILLMPTWRDWINTDEDFLTSLYFHSYNGLIHNERLIKILEENDVHLNFYPHYRAQLYFNDEILNPSKNIHFIQLGSKTVQELLIDHSLLITDYSSVSFDFTLMDKPVVYYHFDVRKFFRQGKLRPLFETFIGDIARTEDDLVDLIEQQIKNGFKTDDLNISGIFEYQDHHNSERIYKSVLEKIKERE